MLKRNSGFYFGFSLVELLISLGLLAFIMAVAIPNLRQFGQDEEVKSAASQLINTLKTAQSSAIAHLNCPSGGGSSTGSWQVNLNTTGSNDTYSLVANCNTTPATQITVLTSAFAVSSLSADKFDASVDQCPSSNTVIRFTNQIVSYDCGGVGGSAWPVTVTISKAGFNTKKVVIEAGGVIRLE